MPRHHQFLKAIRQSSPENLATAAGTRAVDRTTPRYSPISTPNSTASRSAFQRAASGNDGWETSPLALSYWEGAVGNRMRTSGEGQVK